MATFKIYLFGRFCVRHNEQILDGFEARKVQELFCYLLLHRDHFYFYLVRNRQDKRRSDRRSADAKGTEKRRYFTLLRDVSIDTCMLDLTLRLI